jgi:hypothetical protein
MSLIKRLKENYSRPNKLFRIIKWYLEITNSVTTTYLKQGVINDVIDMLNNHHDLCLTFFEMKRDERLQSIYRILMEEDREELEKGPFSRLLGLRNDNHESSDDIESHNRLIRSYKSKQDTVKYQLAEYFKSTWEKAFQQNNEIISRLSVFLLAFV